MTLEEFKEYAKTVTRGEFLTNNAEKYYENFTPVILKDLENACPECVGLKNGDDNCQNCSKCWREAVKDIKFKNDIEGFNIYDSMQEDLNRIERKMKEDKEVVLPLEKMPEELMDNVNHPNHYTQGKYEVIDYIEDKLSKEELQGYCVGNVLKYVSRFKHKNRLEDLKKAEWYLNRLIKNMEGKDEEKR